MAAMTPSLSAQVVVPTGPNTPYYPTGVGPAISGTVTNGRLPQKAHDFLTKHFPQSVIKDIEEEFDSRTFEVDLADGTDIEFDSKGEWTEVDAGRGTCLPPALVKDLLPDRAYREIDRLGLSTTVETVKRSEKSYKVELRGAELDDLRFDREGNLTEIGI